MTMRTATTSRREVSTDHEAGEHSARSASAEEPLASALMRDPLTGSRAGASESAAPIGPPGHRSSPLSRASRESATGEVTPPPVRASGGSPLPSALLARMNASLGHDFGHARIHTDAEADQAAEQVQAKAFTIGAHIWFKQGLYAPGTKSGDELLMHELVHVKQHDEGRLPGTMDGRVSKPTDRHEREAAQLSTHVTTESTGSGSAAQRGQSGIGTARALGSHRVDGRSPAMRQATTREPSSSTNHAPASVGVGQSNQPNDVTFVQSLLNTYTVCLSSPFMFAVGVAQGRAGLRRPDGRIDPGGGTATAIGVTIDRPVGVVVFTRGGGNLRYNVQSDVSAVARALGTVAPEGLVSVDGVFGDETADAIARAQSALGMGHPDAIISPGGETERRIQTKVREVQSGTSGSSHQAQRNGTAQGAQLQSRTVPVNTNQAQTSTVARQSPPYASPTIQIPGQTRVDDAALVATLPAEYQEMARAAAGVDADAAASWYTTSQFGHTQNQSTDERTDRWRQNRAVYLAWRLVNAHGFTPEGASAVVGNLIEESRGLPNIIENNTAANNPQDIAADDRGPYTAHEIMNERYPSSGRRPGRGVGLAQWTNWERRAGLFAFPYNPHEPNAAVRSIQGRQDATNLFCINAQLAYLNQELTNSRLYHNLNHPIHGRSGYGNEFSALGGSVFKNTAYTDIYNLSDVAAVYYETPDILTRVKSRFRSWNLSATSVATGAHRDTGHRGYDSDGFSTVLHGDHSESRTIQRRREASLKTLTAYRQLVSSSQSGSAERRPTPSHTTPP